MEGTSSNRVGAPHTSVRRVLDDSMSGFDSPVQTASDGDRLSAASGMVAGYIHDPQAPSKSTTMRQAQDQASRQQLARRSATV